MTDRLQRVDLPDDVSRYLVGVTDELMAGDVEVWQLPPAVAALWTAAWSAANAKLVERNAYLERELDRLYAARFQGTPLPPDDEPEPPRPASPASPDRHDRLRRAVEGVHRR